MDDFITQILGIKDDGIKVLGVKETPNTLTVTIERKITFHYCDLCGFRMHSKGINTRHVNHPVLHQGRRLVLEIKQRRWLCSNPCCKAVETDEFSFVEKRRRNTNISDFLIVEAFRNPEKSASEIAREHNVSDSHAIRTFARYVDMHRRSMPEALCIDEVYLNIHNGFKYALVLQDFVTGEPIDLVETRRKEKAEPYFQKIPLKERQKVKYVISDMYKPYIDFTRQFFPNAVNIVDSFHVMQAINHEFLKYIRQVIRTLHERDELVHERRELEFHRKIEFRHSKDYLLLKKYYGMLLKNGKDLKVYSQPRFNKTLNRMMTTFDYFDWMYRIDPKLEHLKDLKEVYVSFNTRYAGKPSEARKALPELITKYRECPYAMYHRIADMLENHSEEIINSFILMKKSNGNQARLSNGPIESLNRITKDIKRIGRGYRNFEYIRNRFLFATRKNATVLGKPRDLEDTYLKAYYPNISEDVYDEDLEDNWEPFDNEL